MDGPGRDRTCDLGIKSPLLYRLSYRPVLLASLVGKGYAEGSAVEERLAALGAGRAAVYGATEDEPEQHFLGWADEVDADELFVSGRAWGIQIRHRA